jgi:ring-1,2-phenylacetyl-CoA epoxidase subunit PaaE
VATHFHLLKVKDVRKETPDCISIAFEIPASLQKEFEFTQGQNITIKKTIGGEELRRSYSICSSPFDNELRIAVKQVPHGKFSIWSNNQLRTGEWLEVLPPTGKFYTALNLSNRKNYIAFAAGSGITPILSIIKTTLLTEPNSSFTLIYGNRNRGSIIFKDELDALKNKFVARFAVHNILSREETETPLNNGRIDANKCENIFRHLIEINSCDEFFLCGPEEMIFCVKDYLEEKNVDKKKIHYELFITPGQKTVKAGERKPVINKELKGKNCKVTIKLDGIAFDFDLAYDGEAILDAAIKLGTELPFACKGGVCATCRAKLVEGKVEMDINYALEPEELKNGFILTCQSHPRTEKVVVDYDIK